MPESPQPEPNGSPWPTTRWSIIFGAGREEGEVSEAALQALFLRYRDPIRKYIERKVKDAHQAEDITQDFMIHLMKNRRLARPDPTVGRFRCYLSVSILNFLKNIWSRKSPGVDSLHEVDGAGRTLGDTLADESDKTVDFTRLYAFQVISNTYLRLKEKYQLAGQEKRFDVLENFLEGKNPIMSQRQAAETLGMSEVAIGVAAMRLRDEFADVMLEEISLTVESPEEVQDELNAIRAAFSR